MPIYEYTCSRCAHPFETLVFKTDEKVSCPECGSERVAKRFSVFGVGASVSASPCGESACDVPASGGCPPTGCSMPNCGAFN